MHKLLLSFFVLASCQGLLNAQAMMAQIKYEETIHFEIPEEVKARGIDMPSSRESKKILIINGTESNYVTNKKDIDQKAKDKFNGGRKRRFRGSNTSKNDVLYQDIASGLQLNKKDLFGKEFVIKEEVSKPKWKIIASEQRDILGYTCMKAEFQDTSNLTTAWFTPQIPISFGPAGQSGLPGLILAVSVGEDRIILATDVNLDSQEAKIEVPSDKKTITREEFDTLRDEKRKEMRAMWKRRK